MPFSDESDDDVGFTPPLPADDRLWRHPSEMAAARSGSEASTSVPPSSSPPRNGVRGRSMSLAGAALVVGIALVFGALAVVGALMGNGASSDRFAADPTDPAEESASQELPAGIVRISVSHGTIDTVAGIMILTDGHIITSADALTDAERVTVTTNDGSVFTATIVGVDPITDIGVLDIEGDTHTTIPVVGTEDLAESGATLVVEHNGGDETITVTDGNIKRIAERLELPDGRTMHGMISSTLSRSPQSGASVLCSSTGSVAGLVTNRNSRDRIVYATPIRYALHIAREIIVAGTARHAWIGVLGIDRDASDSDGSPRGTIVTEVATDSPAARAGLQPQDIIIDVMDRPIDSASSLVVAIREFDPGDVATVVYLRDGAEQTASITLGDRPASVDERR